MSKRDTLYRYDGATSTITAIGEENMQKKLFWVAVLYHGKKKTIIVVGPHHQLAKNEAAAKKAAIKEVDLDYKERYDRLEVVVRPF